MKKRLQALILALVMVGIMLSSVGCGGREVVFGVISDVHLIVSPNHDDTQRQENLRKALTYYKENNADLIAVNGDIADLGQAEAYQTFNRIFEEVFPDKDKAPQLIMTADNHEYYDAWPWLSTSTCTMEEVKQRFMTAFGLENTNTSVKIGAYQFIGVSADGCEDGYATYSGETITWLAKELMEANERSSKKPIFVFVHQPPMNTVDVSGRNSVSTLNGVLKQYPQAVVFSSHTHAPLQDERTIHQEFFTTVNTASLYYASAADGLNYSNLEEFARVPKSEEFAQGLLVRVKGKKVDIERHDFYNDTIIGENWVIEKPYDVESYQYTADNKNEVAPKFANDAKGSIKKISDSQYEVTFDTATDDEFVHHYVVNALTDERIYPERTINILADFYLGTQAKTVTCELRELTEKFSYTFEVYAVDCYGNMSEPLIVK